MTTSTNLLTIVGDNIRGGCSNNMEGSAINEVLAFGSALLQLSTPNVSSDLHQYRKRRPIINEVLVAFGSASLLKCSK